MENLGLGHAGCLLQVEFEVGDVTKREFPPESFDVIFSRDTILHIKDKRKLFASFYVSLIRLTHTGVLLFLLRIFQIHSSFFQVSAVAACLRGYCNLCR